MGGIQAIIVRVRDLKTGAQDVQHFAADKPTSPRDQERTLRLLVSALHPEARFRSFGSGAATFTNGSHLIVTRFDLLSEDHGLLPAPITKAAHDHLVRSEEALSREQVSLFES